MSLLQLTINLCGIRTSTTSSNDYRQKLTQFPADTRTAGFHPYWLVLYLKGNRVALEQVGEPEMISLWPHVGPAQIKSVAVTSYRW